MRRLFRFLHHYSQAFTLRFELLHEIVRLRQRCAGAARTYWSVIASLLARPTSEEVAIRLLRFVSSKDRLLLFDIGANTGYWLEHFLGYFPASSVYAFEPTRAAFADLKQRFMSNGSVHLMNVGLSNSDRQQDIAIGADSTFSSLHEYLDPVTTIRSELVELRRFDSVISDSMMHPGTVTIAKIDVQGHEAEVIEGMDSRLKGIDIVIVECSFLPEYAGLEPSFGSLTAILASYGLHPVIFTEFNRTKSPYAFQHDVFFVKKGYFGCLAEW